jgi:pentose-5-phosphate-3-epimerase
MRELRKGAWIRLEDVGCAFELLEDVESVFELLEDVEYVFELSATPSTSAQIVILPRQARQ